MTFTERLKKVKKAAVMTGLAIAGVMAPVKAQTTETVPEKAPITATAEHTDTQRKQLFENAVRTGASKEEIAKYIDFPGFIPVTKNGQFDQEKASEWAKKLAPYMKTLAEKGDKMTSKDAYGIIREATGRKDISFEEFEQVTKMASEALAVHRSKWPIVAIDGAVASGTALLAQALGITTVLFGVGSAFSFKNDKKGALKFLATGALSAVAAFGFSEISLTKGATAMRAFTETPERTISELYTKTYNSYIDNTIKAQQKQFQQMEWNQLKQALSPQK